MEKSLPYDFKMNILIFTKCLCNYIDFIFWFILLELNLSFVAGYILYIRSLKLISISI